MKVLINLGSLLKNDSQALYAQHLLNELLPIIPTNWKITIIVPTFFKISTIPIQNCNIIKIPLLGYKITHILFNQFILPIFVLVNKTYCVYSPTASFPLLLPYRALPTIHDLAYRHYKSEVNFFVRVYINTLYKIAAHKCKFIATVSQTMRNEISKTYQIDEKKIVTIYNALPITNSLNQMCSSTNQDPYVLYIGMYRERKNIKYILEGLAETKIPNIKLILAGSIINQKEQILSYATELAIADKIKFTGIISEDKKICLVKQAVALLFPSLYEGFGLPILEGQAIGTPIITSDIPVLHEIAGNAAIFIDPFNPKKLSEAITEIYTKNTSQIIEMGYENIRRFSWKASAQQLLETIRSYEN